MYKPKFILENETYKILGLWDTSESANTPRRPDIELINKKRRIYHLVDFAIPVNHSENERYWNEKKNT